MNSTNTAQDIVGNALDLVNHAFDNVQKIPGSAIVIRYIRSSYQDDPVRSAMELFLFLFAVYYLVSPSYSTKKQKQIPLTEQVRIQIYMMETLGGQLTREAGNRRACG